MTDTIVAYWLVISPASLPAQTRKTATLSPDVRHYPNAAHPSVVRAEQRPGMTRADDEGAGVAGIEERR